MRVWMGWKHGSRISKERIERKNAYCVRGSSQEMPSIARESQKRELKVRAYYGRKIGSATAESQKRELKVGTDSTKALITSSMVNLKREN